MLLPSRHGHDPPSLLSEPPSSPLLRLGWQDVSQGRRAVQIEGVVAWFLGGLLTCRTAGGPVGVVCIGGGGEQGEGPERH